MQKQINTVPDFPIMKLENFGDMQARYQSLPLDGRASVLLNDAEPAFSTAKQILEALEKNPNTSKALANLRNNDIIISRIRNSEAKSCLMDISTDFIKSTTQKLAKWHNTIQSIAQGKAKASIIKENIPEHFSVAGGSGYLALVKLVIAELVKLDSGNKTIYEATLAEIRRCTTILSDCECASELNSVVMH